MNPDRIAALADPGGSSQYLADNALPRTKHRTIPATPDEIYVGGVWRRGTGDVIESVDPATGIPFATLHGATVDDVDTAVAASLEAF